MINYVTSVRIEVDGPKIKHRERKPRKTIKGRDDYDGKIGTYNVGKR